MLNLGYYCQKRKKKKRKERERAEKMFGPLKIVLQTTNTKKKRVTWTQYVSGPPQIKNSRITKLGRRISD